MSIERYVKHLRTLPVNPSIAAKVLDMVERQEYSFKNLEDIIGADPGLTAKILKIANSALYARQNKVTKLQTAITLLGINTIKNLVILVTGSGLFKQYAASHFCSLFWRHSLSTAFASRALALRLGLAGQSDEAFIAGLLHNIGQVALYLDNPAIYEQLVGDVVGNGLRFSELELPLYGVTHREVGGAVLAQWNFPEMYSDCALEHGNANITSEWKKILLIVSASSFCASNWVFFQASPKPYSLLESSLLHLGMDAPGLETFQAEYRTLLEQDAFYQECQGLTTG